MIVANLADDTDIDDMDLEVNVNFLAKQYNIDFSTREIDDIIVNVKKIR